MSRFTTVFLFTIAAAGLLACDENDPTGTDLTTSSEGAQVAAPVSTGDSATPALSSASLLGTIPLPINQTVTSLEPAFSITQKGEPQVGYFKLDNPTATTTASARGDKRLRVRGAGDRIRQSYWRVLRGSQFQQPERCAPGLHQRDRQRGPRDRQRHRRPRGVLREYPLQ